MKKCWQSGEIPTDSIPRAGVKCQCWVTGNCVSLALQKERAMYCRQSRCKVALDLTCFLAWDADGTRRKMRNTKSEQEARYNRRNPGEGTV